MGQGECKSSVKRLISNFTDWSGAQEKELTWDSDSEPRTSYVRPDEHLDLSSTTGWPQGKWGSRGCQGGGQGEIPGSIWGLGEKSAILGKPCAPPSEQNCQRKPARNRKGPSKVF